MSLRLKKRGEKGLLGTRVENECLLKTFFTLALERALNGATPTDENFLLKGKWKGPEEETIREEAEPATPGSAGSSHKRERAQDDEDDEDD